MKSILEELRKIDAYVFFQARIPTASSASLSVPSTDEDDAGAAASCQQTGRCKEKEELIIRKREGGKFLGPGGSSVPEGQALLSGLLDTAFEMAQDIKAREAGEDVAPALKPIYERLSQMKTELDQLREYPRLCTFAR